MRTVLTDINDSSLPDRYSLNGSDVLINSEQVQHSVLLEKLLKTVEPVNFKVLAGLGDDQFLTMRHYVVYSVKEILRLAKEQKWNICQHHNFIYLYNGCYWSRIENGQLKRFLGEAAKKMGLDESFSDYYSHREQLFMQFKSEAYLPAPERDEERVLVNLKNGTFEITNNSVHLRDFNSEDFLTHQLPFKYDPEAKAPKFKKYLSEVLPDESQQKVLQEYTGYIFIPSKTIKLEKVLMLYGSGSNGKSVFFDILKALVGKENFSTYSLQALTNENGYYRADLADKLVNYASEISGRIETSYFKAMASGEPIEARLPYKDPIVIHNYARLIFNVNQLPQDVEHSEAYFRRFIILPFDVQISEEKRDIQLTSKIIMDELPGIFNWILEGIKRLLEQQKFTHSDKIETAIKTYRMESDSVSLFISDNGYVKSTSNYKTQKELYGAYRLYAYDNGYKAVSNIIFGRRLDSIGLDRAVKSAGKVVYVEKSST